LPGGAYTHWESAAFARRTPKKGIFTRADWCVGIVGRRHGFRKGAYIRDCVGRFRLRFTMPSFLHRLQKPGNRATIATLHSDERLLMPLSIAAQIVGAALAPGLYFLPAILADRRKRHDLLTIALFNACCGWTVFGWLLALYWALQPNPPENVAGAVMAKRRAVRMTAFSQMLARRVENRAGRMPVRERTPK
jgi:hypothetical protein